MAQVNKIDSNVTNLRIAEEASYKVLPGTPTWVPYEPNSYADFGGQITKVARNPINSGRQRKKGVTTDLDANGGFNTDLTKDNIKDLLQGFFYADLRKKGTEIVTAVNEDGANPDFYAVASTAGFLVGSLIKGYNFSNPANNAVNVVTAVNVNTSVEVADGQLDAEANPPANARIDVVGHQAAQGDIDVNASGDFARYVSTSLDFRTLGIIPGEWIYVGGDTAGTRFSNAVNNGWKRVRAIDENEMLIDKSEAAMVDEDNSATSNATIQLYLGHVLKNEVMPLIKRRTYQLERELGAPDDAQPTQIQYEYVIGAVPSEMTLQINSADKIMVDLSFLGADHETIDGPTAAKTGNRPPLVEGDAYNTSSDFSRINMSVVSSSSEAPAPLFAFVSELSITLNNNLEANKAVSVLGAFDVTAGQFQVDASLTAYFGNVAALAAVRNNSDVTLDAIISQNRAGIAIDIPLVALGDGLLNVEQDAPIMVPLSSEAASGAKVHPGMDHTLLLVFYDHLPLAASA